MQLALCPACERHVDVRESSCPFCQAAQPLLAPKRAGGVGRVGRAAIFYFGTSLAVMGCGTQSDTQETIIAQPYGAPPDPPPDDEEPPPEETEPEETQPEQESEQESAEGEPLGQPDQGSMAGAYGAPPGDDGLGTLESE